MSMKKILTPCCTAGLLAALAAGCSEHTESSAPEPTVTASNVTLTADQQQNIHLVTVEASAFHKTVDTTATVAFDSDQATTILAPMSGPVTKVLVNLGDQVKADQPLAEVDSPDFASDISAYRKALATAKITRQLADQDQELLEHHGVSVREADQAKIDATNAAADAEAALQQLVSLKVSPDTIKAIENGQSPKTVPAIIRSPIAGTVVERDISPGELLSGGTTQCFIVADLSRMWVMANLFGPEVDAINVGDPTEVLTDTGTEKFSGMVSNVAAVVDPDTRSVAVRVVAENPDGALRQGMYVRVLIHSEKETPGLLVPVSAVLRDEDNLPFVYVAQADSSYAQHRVILGYREGDAYDIASGVKPGDRVVTEGGLFVQFLQSQ
jgi:cobalt-zinc-cadmium efflux system membrane fusion protein